jgi:hypothetical protein
MRGTLIERFMAKVSPCPITGCHWFTGSVDGGGYGQIQIGPAGAGRLKAHRLAYELAYGPVPDGKFVCHSCDNGNLGCVNPAHLFVGTHLENMADMRRKGRSVRGEANGMSTLTVDAVREIRRLRGAVKQRELAERFGISQGHVSGIQAMKEWVHVA